MKTNEFFYAMGKIDPALVERAERKVVKKISFPKLIAIAAAIALLAASMLAVLPMLLDIEPEETIVGEETLYLFDPFYGSVETAETGVGTNAKYPIFRIVGYKYSEYLIRNAYPVEMYGEIIGEKLDDINVLNGWGYFSEQPAVEHDLKVVKAEVYAVNGVAPDAGVAIKFIEEGPFNSLEHYFAAVNTDYEFTSLADLISDYNAPAFMSMTEVRLEDDTVELRGIEYKKYSLKNGADGDIIKILLTLDAPAEITGGYSTGDERIVEVKNKPTLNLIVNIASVGDMYCNIWVHENGYIAYSGFRQPTVFFNVGKEATDAILKLFYENSELVSIVKMDPNHKELVEYPVN